jgi:cation:H+ antiporter
VLIALAQLAGGFVLLVWAADRLVAGAAATARNLGVSPLIIGLTIVGFGTSAPELVVSAVASFRNNPGLALGNAIGSNIANLGLVLGLTAVIYPLRLESNALKREYPLLILIMLICFLMGLDMEYSALEGWALLSGLLGLMMFLVWLGLQRSSTDPLAEEFAAEIPTDTPTGKAVFWLVVGLLVLPLSSRFLVDGAITIAASLGISDTVVGLTVVAFGTSLPELATAVTSAFRREDDIAIGNIIGSNMFNMLGVLGIAAVVNPISVAPMVLARDYPVMFLLTGLLYLIASDFRGPSRMARTSGLVFLALFVGYQMMVWFHATLVPGAAAG